MDLTRGLAVVLVIAFHANDILRTFGGGSPPFMETLNLVLGPHRMPLLMFLSGMLLARSLTKGPARFFSGKLRGIAWPYVVWTTITLLAVDDLSLDLWVRNLYSPTTPLWYLWFVMANYCLAFLLLRLRLPASLVAAVSLVAAGLVTSAYAADRLCFFFAFFMLGHVVASREPLRAALRRPWVVVVAGLAAAVTSALAASGVYVRFEAVYAWGPLGLVVLVLAVTPALDPEAVLSRALRYVGRHSLVFYCVHWPVMILASALLVRLELTRGGVVYATSLLAALVAGLGLSALAQRSRLADALLTAPGLPRRSRDEVAPTATSPR